MGLQSVSLGRKIGKLYLYNPMKLYATIKNERGGKKSTSDDNSAL